MAFGQQDTIRLCEQYRAAMPPQHDDGYAPLSDRLSRVEEAVKFMAAIQSLRMLTDCEIGRLVAIATGQEVGIR